MNTYFDSEEYTMEYLDEVHGLIDIAGLDYSAGRALFKIDPIAFRQVELDLIDQLLSDNRIHEDDEGELVNGSKPWDDEEEEKGTDV